MVNEESSQNTGLLFPERGTYEPKKICWSIRFHSDITYLKRLNFILE
jgi:hypothetical protein